MCDVEGIEHSLIHLENNNVRGSLKTDAHLAQVSLGH